MVRISALFVQSNGVYSGRYGVDTWDIDRDARNYRGPNPVIAHPPCQRWGRYWDGGPAARGTRLKGDDGGCFAAALASVRRWGGVLEHPQASHAWKAHGLAPPPRHGGWIPADEHGGWTCCVEQGHYGHPAKKATWLYANKTRLPELKWGSCGHRGPRREDFENEADYRRSVKTGVCQRLSKRQRETTPPEFADLLIYLASSVGTGLSLSVTELDPAA